MRTDLTEEGANSTLSVAKINKSDSGNYTCSIGPTHSFTTTVHVLNGELVFHNFLSISTLRAAIFSKKFFPMTLISQVSQSWSFYALPLPPTVSQSSTCDCGLVSRPEWEHNNCFSPLSIGLKIFN